MANDSGVGGHAMATKCPHCGTTGAHPTQKTWPRRYGRQRASLHLQDSDGRVLFHRRRTRRCGKCGREFHTNEVAESDLTRLDGGRLATLLRVHSLEATIRTLEAEIEALREKQKDVSARVMSSMAQLRDPGASRRALTLVRHPASTMETSTA